MANGYFERGEIYWVRMDSGFGFEQGVGRPGVILSCDKYNNSTESVTIAFCSKQPQKAWGVEIEATGCTSYIVCNQVATVDKSRLGKCIGFLNSAEQKELDNVLENYFDLGYVDDAAAKAKDAEIAARDIQIKELKEEIAKLKTEIDNRADDSMATKVEIAMWQRLYEKALDQVCSMKLTGDIARKVEKKAPVVVETPKVPEPVAEDEPALVDINTAKFDELKKCGMSNNVVATIISRRPYTSVEDLKKVPGITSVMYGIFSKKVCCVVPQKQSRNIVSGLVEPDPGYEKVNVNTARAAEIHELAGVNKNAAYSVTGYRKKNGLFKSLDELATIPYWSETLVEKFRDKLEV